MTAVGSHDTASAVVGVPGRRTSAFAYIACGTWSLVGVELDAPVLTEASRAANFTNEGGVDGRVRYLRNVMGLWLLQESLRTWERDGDAAGARPACWPPRREVPPGGPMIDADDPAFLAPGDMPARIADGLPSARATAARRLAPAIVRCILDSLAGGLRARGRATPRGCPVGRSTSSTSSAAAPATTLLCQLTADACGLPVVAGPVEATALGNVLVQARAHGLVGGRPRERCARSCGRPSTCVATSLAHPQ